MADAHNSTTTQTVSGAPSPGAPVPPPLGTTHTTQIRQSQPSTNWFAWMLGGAVVAVGIAALVFGGSDRASVQPAGGNNITIEAPAAAPAPVPDAPAAIAPEPVAPPAAPDAPAVADPVAPAPDAAPAPAGN